MKKKVLLLILSVFMLVPSLRADEGMWLLMFLDKETYKDMKAKGLKLSPKQIYDINNASLKDAIVQFGRGCTGEIVSDQGLLFTNHHCGYPQIQQYSTVEHDYLANGFWAYSKEEELPCPGLTAKFFIRMEDVTEGVLEGVKDEMSEKERYEIINTNIKKIARKSVEDTHYEAVINEMFDGNQYILFVYERFKDVRMVGAPPSSIGKFGSDTDNWMWPRHTGDFAIFRVYSDRNGNPAEYSKLNIPLKPKHHLPISLKGVRENDFAMIIGFPGSTDRFASSFGVENAINTYNPSVVNARSAVREVMDKDMRSDRKIRIQYATKFAQLSNYWKFYIGQTKCLEDLDVSGTKRDLEKRLSEWIAESPEREKEYGEVINNLGELSEIVQEYDFLRIYTNEAILRGSSAIGIGLKLRGLERELSQKGKTDRAAQMAENLKDDLKEAFKDYNEETEVKILAAGMDIYFKNVPIKHQSIEFMDLAFEKGYDFDLLAEEIFANSMLTKEENALRLLENLDSDQLSGDPLMVVMNLFINNLFENLDNVDDASTELDKNKRLFVKALMEMDSHKHFAPDANSSIRYTYGQVKSYKPQDGVVFDYYTTLEGVMKKDDPERDEFTVPSKLKELYNTKDFGRYEVNGTVPVCFITNNDITGGNSGSPVLNARGHLIGLAFDGNWEAMSGNLAFNPELQRCINVDIRYVLFIIDKFAGAQNIINELTIVR